MQDIEKGNHDYNACKDYCQRYKDKFGQELPDCQFKGNKSKIQDLIRKVHVTGGFNFAEAATSSPSFAFGAPTPAVQAPLAHFVFVGTGASPAQQQAPSSMPETPIQQGPNMFSIGAGPSQPPKGRQIARARRTRK